MSILTYKPAPPLSDFVDVFWLCETYEVPHEKERLLPDGSVELVVNLREDCIRNYDSYQPEKFETIPGCVVSGPRSQFFVIDTEGESATIGVHFKPGGAFPFLKVPPCELANQSVALECLWGSGSSRMRERLLSAGTPPEKFRQLETCLLEQISEPLEHHAAVNFALCKFLHPTPLMSVADVVEQVGFSQRYFIQLFAGEVGLTPKVFSRVCRFQKAIQSAHTRGDVDWAEVALSCGYYDQAHFIHDFQSFAGITPSSYLRQKSEHVNHVPMLE
jgi:AraC-like DNA-binding protein